MFLSSVVLDGFKSYGKRTEIGLFDPSFNAITGLNGSGKSNTFDAICFVLGISNLSLVRATSMQDLVYKNGKSGITKAIVTLIFNNRVKSKAPSGYQAYDEIKVSREINVGGKSKYLMNGVNVTSHKVIDFFKTAGLNVNCPHFLIMQGQITKVLSMQSHDILAMIEEAAATRLYAEKRENYQKTDAKKALKLHEIDQNINEKLNPSLIKFEEDKKSYINYQNLLRNIEKLSKFEAIGKYKHIKKEIVKLESNISSSGDLKNELAQSIEFDSQKQIEVNAQLDEIKQKLLAFETGDAKQLRSLMNSLEKKLAMSESSVSILNDQKIDYQSQIKVKQSEIEAETKEIGKKQESINALASGDSGINSEYAQLQNKISELEKEYQLLCTGKVVDESGKSVSIQDELRKTNGKISSKRIEITNSQKKFDYAQSKRDSLSSQIKKFDLKSIESAQKSFESAQSRLQYLTEKLDDLQKQKDQLRVSETSLKNIQKDSGKCYNDIRTLKNQYQHFDFKYTTPKNPKFDESKICGMVYELFKVNDNSFNKSLETIAGWKLFNVVTENEEIVNALVSEGRLQTRTNFLPLSKLRASSIPKQIFENAAKLVGKENVFDPCELISFDSKFADVMKFVFGSVIICKNMEQGKLLAYHNTIRKKVVTLDGELINPVGTLSGGSTNKNSNYSHLAIATKIHTYKDAISHFKNSSKTIQANKECLMKTLEPYNKMMQEKDELEAKLTHLKTNQTLDNFNEMKAQLKQLEEQINNELQNNLKTLQAELASLESQAKNLESQISSKSEVKNTTDSVKKQIDSLKKQEKKLKNDFKKEIEAGDILKSEIELMQNEVKAFQLEISNLTNKIEDCERELAEKNTQIEQLNGELNENKVKYDEIKNESASLNKIKEDLQKQERNLCQSTMDKKSKIDDVSEKLKQLQCTHQSYETNLKKLIKENSWIESENSETIFSQYQAEGGKSSESISKTLQKLTQEKSKLDRHMNQTAMSQLEKIKNETNDLKHKRKLIEKDRRNIAQAIKKLDEMKKSLLEKAIDTIGKSFSNIFTTLLPGANCKLVTLRDENTQGFIGIQIKVSLGTLWVESLTELSGGQRSLVALSLILAILKYKPAPLYILDEVDAALDPAHTQNIGHVIKKHFGDSQFLIISLKEGMFTNSNVLFNVKLDNGLSTVSRMSNV